MIYVLTENSQKEGLNDDFKDIKTLIFLSIRADKYFYIKIEFNNSKRIIQRIEIYF